MFTITLSAQELQNLRAFLLRIQLSAKEVVAFQEVTNKINGAKRVEEKKPEEKKN